MSASQLFGDDDDDRIVKLLEDDLTLPHTRFTVGDAYECVSQCFDSAAQGLNIDDVIASELPYTLTDNEWCLLTSALMAWHYVVTSYVKDLITRKTDGYIPSDVSTIIPEEELIESVFAINVEHSMKRNWEREFRMAFNSIGIHVLPDSVPLHVSVGLNGVSSKSCNTRSLDQLDSWLYSECIRSEANGKRQKAKLVITAGFRPPTVIV